jgi:hypothetical protein
LHTASALSRNLKRPWLKDLELITLSKLSLSNQDKVEIGKSSLSGIIKKLCLMRKLAGNLSRYLSP